SSRRRHTRFSRDWSSDVCSSDLTNGVHEAVTETQLQAGDVCRVAPPNPARMLSMQVRADGKYTIICFDSTREVRSAEEIKGGLRSEERRVGKECRARWSP